MIRTTLIIIGIALIVIGIGWNLYITWYTWDMVLTHALKLSLYWKAEMCLLVGVFLINIGVKE